MSLLPETTILLLAAALAALFGKFSRIGSVLAFVGIGVLIGPWGLSFITGNDDILHFSEIGVVFLLFIIGLELQPKRLWALRRLIFGAGTLQLTLTALALFPLLLLLADFAWQPALVIAYGLALSSTAFALRLLADHSELQSSQGKLGFGVLLFQDLAVIPFLAALPFLAGDGAVVDSAGHPPMWLSFAIFVLFLLAGHYLLIPFLRLVAWTGVHEAFTATSLLLVLGSAFVMEEIGLSMGLGAFLAGVLVAESEYRHQLEADIEPFKGLLLGLFFMAVGMSTNFGILRDEPATIVLGVLVLIALKSVLLYVVGRIYGLGNTRAARLAAYLCQGGEFGFVAFTLASSFGILSASTKDMLIVVVTLSMALTPAVLKLVSLCFRSPTPSESELAELSLGEEECNDIIIAGFGRFGQILGRVLNAQAVHYTAIDINPEQVRLVRQFGNRVFYGDLSRPAVLETAGVERAKIFALCIDDMEASIEIIRHLKHHYPNLKLFCRARNRYHEIRLREYGADYVIRETLLSGLEFTRQVLGGLGYDSERAGAVVATFQAQDEKLIRQQAALINDKASMIQSAQEAATELSRLMRDESELPGRRGKNDAAAESA